MNFVRSLIVGLVILLGSIMIPSVCNAQITAMSGTCTHHSDVWGEWDTVNIHALGYVTDGYGAYASFRIQRPDGTWAFVGTTFTYSNSFHITSGDFFTGGMTGAVPHSNMYSVSADLYKWSVIGQWPNLSQQWTYVGTYYGYVWDNSSTPTW